jgi:Transposase, Mutator family
MEGSIHSSRQSSVSVMLIMAVAAFAACLVALLWWQAEPAHSATTVPAGFTDKLVAQVNNPTSMAIAPDGRIFVAQKGGKIRIIKNGQLLSKPFLTLCTVHFERNVLSHVPPNSMAEVAQDLKAIFKVRREKTAEALAEEFVEIYEESYPKAVSVFEAGIEDALTYLRYPGSHHARIRTTNMLERLFKEVKRRTRVVGVFPSETSANTLATEIALRSSEEWALRRYLTIETLEEAEKPNPQLSRH